MNIVKTSIVTSIVNYCLISKVYALGTTNSLSVTANGFNTLNLDMLSLITGKAFEICQEVPDVTLTATTLSNTRPTYLVKSSTHILWSHAANDFTPPAYASAVAHFGITIIITTPTSG